MKVQGLLKHFWRVAVPGIALYAPITGRAQDVAPAPDRWAGGAELALNAARGNSSFTMLTSALRFTHINKKQFELDWANALTYGESNGKVIARRMQTALKGDLHPQDTWSPFVFGSAERDRIRRIDLQTNLGAGAKWTYFRNPPGAASISVAAIHTYKGIVAAAVGAPTTIEPRRSTARMSIRPKVVQRWPSGLSIEQTSFWQPVIGMIDDYSVEASSRVGFAASKTKTLFAQHTYRVDSHPPTGVKREDQLLVAGVKIQF